MRNLNKYDILIFQYAHRTEKDLQNTVVRMRQQRRVCAQKNVAKIHED